MRMRLLKGSAGFCVLLFAACSAPTSGSAADESALRAMGAKYADAFNKRDSATLASMVTDDYQSVHTDGTVTKGKTAYQDAERQSAALRTGLSVKLSVVTTYVKWAGADHAELGGTWMMAGLPAGMGADKGAWSGLAEKGADAQWRLATGLIAEYVPPPAPAPKATPPPKPVPKGRAKHK